MTTDVPEFQQLKTAIMSDEILFDRFSCDAIESRKRLKVLRFFGESSVDFRTGQTMKGTPTPEKLLLMMQSGLPLPKEFTRGEN